MITKVQSPEDVKDLYFLNDDMEDHFNCTRDEWIQYITEKASSDEYGIWISKNKQGEVDSYLILINNVNPPLQDSVVIIYLWSVNHNALLQIAELGEIWAKTKGAKGCTAKVSDDFNKDILEVFGFEVVALLVEKRFDE